jgi:hypothetical protein
MPIYGTMFEDFQDRGPHRFAKSLISGARTNFNWQLIGESKKSILRILRDKPASKVLSSVATIAYNVGSRRALKVIITAQPTMPT